MAAHTPSSDPYREAAYNHPWAQDLSTLCHSFADCLPSLAYPKHADPPRPNCAISWEDPSWPKSLCTCYSCPQEGVEWSTHPGENVLMPWHLGLWRWSYLEKDFIHMQTTWYKIFSMLLQNEGYAIGSQRSLAESGMAGHDKLAGQGMPRISHSHIR